jgi:glutamyl-tRNA reductase
VTACAHVAEAAVIATCNRLEIYAEVDRFHGSVEEVSRLLVERAGEPTEAMLPHLYVHYEDGAVSHLFHVAAGLDSMAVGEGQILGQTRTALRTGQEHGTVGSALNVLFQQALRVGKRSRAETGIDQAAPTLVSEALRWLLPGGVSGLRVLVLGAGGMAALATATAARQGAEDVVVVNRTPENAARLASEYAVRSAPLGALAEELAAADLLITCTGATGVLVGADQSSRPGPTSGRSRSPTWRSRTTSTPTSATCPASRWWRSPTSPIGSATPRPARRSTASAGSSARRSPRS